MLKSLLRKLTRKPVKPDRTRTALLYQHFLLRQARERMDALVTPSTSQHWLEASKRD